MAKWGAKSSGDSKRGGAGYRADPQVSGDGPTKCPECGGSGFISREVANRDLEDEDYKSAFHERKCTECNGEGKVW